MDRLKLATIWLGGCSGCHMSFLDLDEFLIPLAARVEVVFSPVVDIKEYPDNVDVVLIEGAVCNEEHVELVHKIRRSTKTIIAFGDCAVTGNVTALRNPLGKAEVVLRRSYEELADVNPRLPQEAGIVPPLLDRVLPVHQVVPVEVWLPGCPPPAARIRLALEQLLETGSVHLSSKDIQFG